MQEILDDSEPKKSEKKLYKGKYAGVAEKLRVAEQQMTYARNSLFVLGGLTILGIILLVFNNPLFSTIDLGIYVVLAVIFFASGFLAKKHPIPSFIVALSIYLLLQLLNVMVEPSSWYRGIILKVIIIFFLISGLIAAFRVKGYKDTLAIADAEMMDEENQ